MNLTDALKRLPKTDLHCHLDGSMRAETILDIARRERIDLGVTDLKQLRRRLVCGERVNSLETFLQAFDLTCAVLQSAEAIERVAYELAEDAAQENVWVLEVRFAPVLCAKKGLTPEEVVRAAARGLARAEARYAIRTGIIICALRNLAPTASIEHARLAASLKPEGVIGFDLAQAERGHPAGVHVEAFRIAREAGLRLTVHAGEDAGPESIRDAIDTCGAERIGHGRTLSLDAGLEADVARKRIAVECCPSSNVQIGLVKSFREHPLKGLFDRGVRVTLNTDNRLLTGISVTDEYLRAEEHLGFSWEELCTIARNGFEATFLPDRDRLLSEATALMERLRISEKA